MGIRRSMALATATAACAVACAAGLAHAEVINGTNRDDRLRGGGADDRIFGKGGDDEIAAGRGSDLVEGGAGNDFIEDGYDRVGDRLYGGKGDDGFIVSGPDKAYGGAGKDSFNVFLVTRRTFVDCGPGRDLVFYVEENNKPRTKGCEQVQFNPIG